MELRQRIDSDLREFLSVDSTVTQPGGGSKAREHTEGTLGPVLASDFLSGCELE
jgi:hypothetical protein